MFVKLIYAHIIDFCVYLSIIAIYCKLVIIVWLA